MRYVKTKVLKRMESYRFKKSSFERSPKLLLPVSGSVSSIVLLQVLDSQLQRQLTSRGRTAYDLHILIVDTSAIDPGSPNEDMLDQLENQFPSYRFSMLPLAKIFELDENIHDALSTLGFATKIAVDPQEALEGLFNSATTPTTRSDMLETFLLRMVVSFANFQKCESVLWGHSDSHLAAKALSSVAKGRGSSLASQFCDGPSPWGVHFNYPLRGLFKSELELYASLLPDLFSNLVTTNGKSLIADTKPIRETSIDELLAKYVGSQGQKYPSIMANVVRTVSKLQVAELSEDPLQCPLCAAPIAHESKQFHGGDNPLVEVELCYGCSRQRLELKAMPGT